MRAKIRPNIVIVIAAQLACFATLLPAARPTHALSHESRRLILPGPVHESAHNRAHHQAGRHADGGDRRPAHAASNAHHANADRHEHHARRNAERQDASQHPHSTHHRARLASVHENLVRDRSSREPADHTTAARVHAWERTQSDGSSDGLTATVSATSPELPRVPTIEQEAATPVLLPSLYDKRGHLVVPPPLYGSHDVLVHQNLMADHDGLARVRDDEDLLDLRRQRKLVALPETPALHIDDRLPVDRRFSRPWTAEFLTVLSHDFYASFHEPLQVNSAVRTIQIQQHLLRINGNAAPASGDTASPHLTGQAIDIGKRGLSMPEIAWMRAYLQPLMEEGKIDVEEEFQQSCFHISVYRAYQQPNHFTLAATPPSRLAAAN